MQGQIPIPQDANLQLMNAATKTETFTSDVVDLGAGFAPQPDMPARVVMNTTALDLTSTNETYTIEVEESADNSTWTKTGLSFTVTATGLVSKIFGVTKRYVRLAGTLAGTTPSITASAWVNRA